MSKFNPDPNGVGSVAEMGVTQIFVVTNSSVQSTAFGANTTILRLASSLGHCHFEIGSNPTASITTSPMMPANTIEYVKAYPGDKIAVIKASGVTASTFSVTELI